jgi:nucleoside-triphosphatase THEP1
LKGDGVILSGITAPAVYKGKEKIGYDIVNIADSRRKVLARKDKNFKDGFSIGPYKFSEKGFNDARKILLDYKPSGFVFLDEAGPLELKGKGYADIIKQLLNSSIKRLYVVVRSSCLHEFKDTFLNKIKNKNITVLSAGNNPDL